MNRRLFLCSTLGAAARGAENIAFTRRPGRIDVSAGGQPFTSFHYAGQWDKPFLWPLRSASGVVVSRGFPIEKREGETSDHTWQRGIWFSHGDINGVDYWRELGREKTGVLKPRSAPAVSRGTIRIDLDLMTPAGKSLGLQREEFSFAQSGQNLVIDAAATVAADRGVALKMGDTEEGWFGIRLHDGFREDRGAVMTNSEGVKGRKIWGQRARWVDYTTQLEGRTVGVAAFDHPSNPKHPTYWHARHYGLCSANPFGERAFTRDKSRDGSVSIPEGGRLVFRYRVVIHPGDAAEAAVEKLYAQFARRR